MPKSPFLLIFRFLLCGLLASILDAEAIGAPSVVKIDVQGNRKIETSAIKQKILTKPGAALSMEVVRQDIKAIFALGYFDNVQVEQEEVPGGVHLFYVVKERPIIAKIVFDGLSSLETDEVKGGIAAKEYEVLDIHKLNLSVQKINELYEEKGYYLADVRYDIQLNEKRNDAEVTFKIVENDKVEVRDINIIGNTVVSDATLKGYMQTREGDFFSWLTGSGAYRESVFERDIATLGYYYGTLGHVRARFGKPEVSVSPDKKFISIAFNVEEGDEFKVGKVDFAGELLFSKEELQNEMLLQAGDVFNTDTLRRETLRLTEKYSDLGFAFANVVPQPVIHDDTKTVDIVFEVDKGQRVYLGRISITGNTRTKDRVIRRELTVFEGELFNGTKKRESRDNVLRLGFFDEVEFHQTTSKVSDEIVDIEIKVKERSTGQLIIGAGYGAGVGFTFNAQLSQNNFLGNGQVASLSAQLLTGQNYYDFNLGFQDPQVGASLWSLGGDLYQLQRELFSIPNLSTYKEIKTGFDVKLGHPVLEFTNLFLTYKLEKSFVDPATIIDQSIVPPSSVNGWTSSATMSMVFDHRDDRFEARKGWYWTLSGEYAGLGGDRFFARTKGEVRFFYPLFWDFVFRSRMSAGNIAAIGNNIVPVNERFILGGMQSMRGYNPLSVGPSKQITAGSGGPLSAAATAALASTDPINFVVGGHSEVLYQAEIEFPILKEAKIKGVLFFDVGNAFDGNLFRPTDGRRPLYSNVGWGFRWFTPIGPLRFEFGHPIFPGGAPVFNFTIGPPF